MKEESPKFVLTYDGCGKHSVAQVIAESRDQKELYEKMNDVADKEIEKLKEKGISAHAVSSGGITEIREDDNGCSLISYYEIQKI